MKKTTGNKRGVRKGIAIALIVVIVLAVGALIGVGNFLVDYAIGRSGDGGNRQVALKVDDAAVAQTKEARNDHASVQNELTRAFYEQVPEQPVTIKSADDLTLYAGFYPQDGSHLWALLAHGYRGNHYGMLSYAQRYYAAGYQVLAPDMRGCGSSEGDFVGMGWPDRLDMLRWIDWILQQDPQARIVLHGISMGGATVMMTSGEPTPDAVIAFVEDCGYTSVWDIFSSELDLRFHLPDFPILTAASMVAKLRAGYSFTEASSVNQVAASKKPMLFIHGDQDNFVPYSMLQVVYDAKPGDNKQLVSVPGAGHGLASAVMGQAYWDTVFAFIDQYMPVE